MLFYIICTHIKPNFDISTDAGSLFDILKMCSEMTNSNMYNIVDE